MKRWDVKAKQHRDVPAIDAFLGDIEAVCQGHNLSISHQDGHGSFKVVMYDDDIMNWLKNAEDDR